MSFLRLLILSLIVPTAALAQQPDSVVVRNDRGGVISRSSFSTEDREIIEETTDSDRVVRTISCYDVKGRLTSKSRYELRQGSWSFVRRADYRRSADGRLLSVLTTPCDGRQAMTSYSYDPDGRISVEMTYEWDAAEMDWTPAERLDYSFSFQPLPLPSRSFAVRTRSVWDAVRGQWKPAADVVSYDYDSRGRLVSRCSSAGDAPADTCATMAYDEQGRLASVRVGLYGPQDHSAICRVDYSYDKAGRIMSRSEKRYDGRSSSRASFHYSSRPKRAHADRQPRLASVETLDAATRGRLCLVTLFYDSLGRVSGEAVDSVVPGRPAVRRETAFAYAPSGRLAKTVSAVVLTADSAQSDDDMPFDTYLQTLMDEAGNPVASFVYDNSESSRAEVGRACQWRNTYDAQGRIVASVRSEAAADGLFVRRDSASTAYDIPQPRSAAVADSVTRVGRIWMRLAGFFTNMRKSAEADTIAAGVCAADSLPDAPMAETIVYEWDGAWRKAVKKQRVYDEEGHLTVEYSYRAHKTGDGWALERKEVYSYEGVRLSEVEVYAPDAESGRLSLVAVRKCHYY